MFRGAHGMGQLGIGTRRNVLRYQNRIKRAFNGRPIDIANPQLQVSETGPRWPSGYVPVLATNSNPSQCVL
jgi:hypothetical protein